MDVNFKPLHDIVLIKRTANETTTSGGIYLPGGKQEASRTGVVLAVGKGKYCDNTGVFVETTVKPGDEVLFSERSGHQIKLKEYSEKEDLIIMREVEIIGVFTKQPVDTAADE